MFSAIEPKNEKARHWRDMLAIRCAWNANRPSKEIQPGVALEGLQFEYYLLQRSQGAPSETFAQIDSVIDQLRDNSSLN